MSAHNRRKQHPLLFHSLQVTIKTNLSAELKHQAPNCPQMIPVYLILRVYSGVSTTFRTPSTEDWSTGGLNTATTGSMRSTEGPNVSSIESISSTGPRVKAVPAASDPAILGVQEVSAVQSLEIMRVLAVMNPEILPVLLSTPVAPTESNLLQLPLVGPSVNVSAKQCA